MLSLRGEQLWVQGLGPQVWRCNRGGTNEEHPWLWDSKER